MSSLVVRRSKSTCVESITPDNKIRLTRRFQFFFIIVFDSDFCLAFKVPHHVSIDAIKMRKINLHNTCLIWRRDAVLRMFVRILIKNT